jgi:hypothetical protein
MGIGKKHTRIKLFIPSRAARKCFEYSQQTRIQSEFPRELVYKPSTNPTQQIFNMIKVG